MQHGFFSHLWGGSVGIPKVAKTGVAMVLHQKAKFPFVP
jgi:hypothetical protein